MIYNQFRGTGVAIVTPFKNGEIDFKALAFVIEYLILGEIDYIVALGTTGEATSLSDYEEQKIAEFILEKVEGRIPIILGCFGGNNTTEIVSKIKSHHIDQFDAIMSSSPSYVRPSQEGIYRHYMVLAEASPKPLLIYNVPSRTATNIKVSTIVRLANSGAPFLGVKEASGNLTIFGRLMKSTPENFLVISGDDFTAFHSICMGGDGVISVLGNAYPKLFAKMVKLIKEQKVEQAAEIHLNLLEFANHLFIEGSPTGVKAALNYLKICGDEVRLPLTSMSQEGTSNLISEMMKLK